MTRVLEHTAALLIAVLLATVSLGEIVSVPDQRAEISAPLIA